MAKPKIKVEQFERDCPANTTMRSKGNTRGLIRDFRVLVDDEHRANLYQIRYGGRGYELGDVDHRWIKWTPPHYNPGHTTVFKIDAQAMFLPRLQQALDLGLIPTLADIDQARADDAERAAKRRREQLANDIKRTKEHHAEALYDALKGVAALYGWIGLGGKLSPTAERAVAVLKLAETLPRDDD